MHALLVSILLGVGDIPAAPPDVVVVCPESFRPAMQPWHDHRARQGHTVQFVSNSGSAGEVRQRIRTVANKGNLRFVLLIGDAPAPPWTEYDERPTAAVRTASFRIDSRVGRYWGGERSFASDNPYADLDDDGVPDVAIGRITAHSREELSLIMGKILAYEQSRDFGPWRTRVNCVAGQAGLGSLGDSIGECFLRSLIGQGIPQEYRTSITSARWASPFCPNPRQFHQCCLDRLNEGALFWVFMGHGNPYCLQEAIFPDHHAPLLREEDCPSLHAKTPPIAICLCCYAGAFAENPNCLAEELLRAPGGPVAVYSGSSVTMPYGMAVMSSAAMQEFFVQQRPTLGEWLLWTKRDTLAAHNSPVWCLVNALLSAAAPPGIDPRAERLEHVQLFNLLGDPTMPLRHPLPLKLEVAGNVGAGGVIHVEGRSLVDGNATIELVPPVEQRHVASRTRYDCSVEAGKQFDDVYRKANNPQWAVATVSTQNGRFAADLRVPAEAFGHCHVRVFVTGSDSFALGGSELSIVGPTEKSPPSHAVTAAAPRETR